MIVLLSMPFTHAPELPAPIVMVYFCQLPGILIKVHVSCRVDVTFAWLDLSHNLPNSMQFIAGQILIDMTGLEDVGVLEVWRVELVAVVRDVQLLFSDKLPGVSIRCAVEHVEVVRRGQTIGRGGWAIIGNLWRPAYTSLTCTVQPSTTWLFYLVDGFVKQQHVAGQARGPGHPLQEIKQDVISLALV
ncbi:hypothetical protein D3C84_455070 [compost metagenome]